MLQQVGLRTLGQVRALPRGPLARRFGAPLLLALDQAYGLKPEVHDWLCLPDVFDERLELPSRIDDAAQLLFAAQLLLARLHAWLLARRAGATAIELRWRHDFAARSAGEGGALQVRTAQAARDVVHLGRLLRERLNATTLGGPVGEIALRVLAWEPLAEMSGSFLPDPLAQGEGLQQLLERLGERLGATQVLRASLQDDWRLHHAQVWREAAGILAKVQVRAVASLEHAAALPVWPTFVLPEPLPLLVKRHVPHYQGPLVLLAGPERVESVWWEVSADQLGGHPTGKTPDPTTQRDYFLAYSSNAGLLWIYKERLPDAQRQDDSFQWALAGMLA